MKNKLLSILFTLTSVFAIGQNYKISPSKTVSVSAPYNDTSKFEIYLENISNTTITLNWELISNKLVAGWNNFICDNVSCCQGVPQKGTLPYIDPGIEVYLALNVDPNTIPGNGILKLYVHEDGNTTNGDTLTWIVNASPTGVNELALNPAITLFPNPISDYVTIDLSAAYPSEIINTLCIYNSIGEKLLEKRIINNAELEKIDMTTLPEGAYLLVITDGDKKQFTKTFIK